VRDTALGGRGRPPHPYVIKRVTLEKSQVHINEVIDGWRLDAHEAGCGGAKGTKVAYSAHLTRQGAGSRGRDTEQCTSSTTRQICRQTNGARGTAGRDCRFSERADGVTSRQGVVSGLVSHSVAQPASSLAGTGLRCWQLGLIVSELIPMRLATRFRTPEERSASNSSRRPHSSSAG
jgi:hypothetical protein